jgi:hypothetical protein
MTSPRPLGRHVVHGLGDGQSGAVRGVDLVQGDHTWPGQMFLDVPGRHSYWAWL